MISNGYDCWMSAELDLDSHSLRVVDAIAEHGSITAAADALGYSQPAISQHLKRLDQRIGMPVVERVGRGVRLTEAGLVLARHARPVIRALDAAAGELAELTGLRSGRVRLAAFPSASPTIVPRLLAAMTARHPGINISYIEAEPPEAVSAVREGKADLALTFSYPGDRVDPHTESAHGLRAEVLSREEMMLVLPAGHERAASETVDVATLAGEAWIAGCPRCRGHLLELCDAGGFTPRIGYETDNFLAVMSMVAAGLGVAMLPTLAIESAGTPAGVVVRPTSNRNHRTIHVVTTPGATHVPAIAATLRVLEELTTSPADSTASAN